MKSSFNRLEADYIQKMESGTFLLEVKDLYQASGLPEDGFEKVISLLVRPNLTSIDTPRFQLLGDGDTIARGRYRFICVDTPGHSKCHMCLYEPDKKMLVSGGYLLKNVIPPLFGTNDNGNPLKEYLLSLDKVYGLDIDIVLPGHGQPFRNTRQRIEEIKEHHQQNRKILSILREGSKNMYETSLRMTQKRNSSSTTLLPILQSFHAVHQVFTHLKYLEEEGKIERRTKGKVAIYSLPETC
jgi:glyoxylase-like metal-dependent hydrolase (beta-lactamase superfamily II)